MPFALWGLKEEEDGSTHYTYHEIDQEEWDEAAEKRLHTIWKNAHPDQIWILEEITPSLFWVTDRCSISPIKTFHIRDRAIAWLDAQGADWLFRKDWDALQKRNKRI